MRNIEDEFEHLAYFPGSSKPLVPHATRRKTVAPPAAGWDAKPRSYVVGGVTTEFFTVGQLGAALGRKASTMRRWEREGIIPKATFRVGSEDARGVRRLYSRRQVEGMVRIAAEEGVLQAHAIPIKHSRFTERVIALFKEK